MHSSDYFSAVFSTQCDIKFSQFARDNMFQFVYVVQLFYESYESDA